MKPRSPVTDLVLADAAGPWAVRSASATVYFVDADASLLLRRPGLASSVGASDGLWVPLLLVESLSIEDRNVLRIGDRHKYTFHFAAKGAAYGWWLQRRVTTIESVSPGAFASLPARPGRTYR